MAELPEVTAYQARVALSQQRVSSIQASLDQQNQSLSNQQANYNQSVRAVGIRTGAPVRPTVQKIQQIGQRYQTGVKNFQAAQSEAQKAIQKENDEVNQAYKEAQLAQQTENTRLADLQSRTGSGNISLQEFENLFGSQFSQYPEQSRSDLEKLSYYDYLISKGKNLTQEQLFDRALAGKFSSNIFKDETPNINSNASKVLNGIPIEEKLLINGKAAIGGYSSSNGSNVIYVKNQSAVTQFPAQFESKPFPFESNPFPVSKNPIQFEKDIPGYKEALPVSFVVGNVQGARFVNAALPNPKPVQLVEHEIPKENFPTYNLGRDIQIIQENTSKGIDFIANNTAKVLRENTPLGYPQTVLGAKRVIGFTSGVNKYVEETLGNTGAYLGESALAIELEGYRRKAQNPEFYLMSENYPVKPGKPLKTAPQIKAEAEKKIAELLLPQTKVGYGEIGAQALLTAQYYLSPQYTILKTVAGGASDLQENRPNAAVFSILTAGALYFGGKILSKGLENIASNFSDTYPIEYGSGFKDIVTEKFVPASLGARNQFITGTLVPTAKGLFENATNAYVVGTIGLEAINIGERAQAGESSASIRKRTVESSRETGYFLTTTQALTGIEKATQVFSELAKARSQLKTEIPFNQLESSQVTNHETLYPKDTLNAKDFLNKIDNISSNPDSFQNQYFDKKYFQDQVLGFHVTQTEYQPSTYVQRGTSELPGLFVNPFNPSFTFGLIKTVSGIGGYRFGYELPSSGGPAQAIAIYGKDISTLPATELGSANKGEFYIPTDNQGVFRTKSEAEVILPEGTKLIKVADRYFTVENNLAGSRGYPFGAFVNIPEYKVSSYQNKNGSISGISSDKDLSMISTQSIADVIGIGGDSSFGLTPHGEHIYSSGYFPVSSKTTIGGIFKFSSSSAPILDFAAITGTNVEDIVSELKGTPAVPFTDVEKVTIPSNVGAFTSGFTPEDITVHLRPLPENLSTKVFQESTVLHELEHASERFAGIFTGRPKSEADYFISPSEQRAYAVQERFLQSKGTDLPADILFSTGVKGNDSLIGPIQDVVPEKTYSDAEIKALYNSAFRTSASPVKYEYSGPASYGAISKAQADSSRRILEDKSAILVSPYSLLQYINSPSSSTIPSKSSLAPPNYSPLYRASSAYLPSIPSSSSPSGSSPQRNSSRSGFSLSPPSFGTSTIPSPTPYSFTPYSPGSIKPYNPSSPNISSPPRIPNFSVQAPPKKQEYPSKSLQKFSGFTGYDVFVLKNINSLKQFIEVDGKGTSLSKDNALKFGQSVTDQSLEASFFIKPSKSPVVDVTGLPDLSYKFRISKQKIRKTIPVYVEIESYRLDTPTEVKKIHAARIAAALRKQYIIKSKTPNKANKTFRALAFKGFNVI